MFSQGYGAPICGAQIATTANFVPSNSLVMGNNACYAGSPQILSAGVPPIITGGYAGAYSSRTLIPPVLGTTPVYPVTPGLVGSGVYGNGCCSGGCYGCDPTCGICACLSCGLCCSPVGGYGCCGPTCGGGVGTIGGIGNGCCGVGCPGCFGCGYGPVGCCASPYGFGCCPTCCWSKFIDIRFKIEKMLFYVN